MHMLDCTQLPAVTQCWHLDPGFRRSDAGMSILFADSSAWQAGRDGLPLLLAGPCLKAIVAAPQITPPVSVQKQLEYLATVTQQKDNGRFVDNTGKDLPW